MSFWRDVGLRVQLYVGKLLFMMRGVSAILYLVPSVTMSHVNVRMSVRCRRDGMCWPVARRCRSGTCV